MVELTEGGVADDVRHMRVYKKSTVGIQKSLESQFLALSKMLEEWRLDNAEHLLRCVVAYTETRDCPVVYFFAVQNSNKYNMQFSRNLTLLEIKVEDSEHFDRVNLKVMELPKTDTDDVKKFAVNYACS